jgi:hypothetical protein
MYNFEKINTSDPQKIGGLITYASRYAIKSLFCIPIVDDNDPDESFVPQGKSYTTPKYIPPVQIEGCITLEQQQELMLKAGNNQEKIVDICWKLHDNGIEMKQKNKQYIPYDCYDIALSILSKMTD